MLGKLFAASYYVAVFGSGKASSTIGYFTSNPWNFMRASKVGFADGAVHSAGRNKLRGKFVTFHYLIVVGTA